MSNRHPDQKVIHIYWPIGQASPTFDVNEAVHEANRSQLEKVRNVLEIDLEGVSVLQLQVFVDV